MKEFVTKDSGKRVDYDSGMKRDTQENKPRFDLITPLKIPYKESLQYRHAMIMKRGMEKYGARNWEKANSVEEFFRFKASFMRHQTQFFSGETDEDHAAAMEFNLNAIIYLMWLLNVNINGESLNKKNLV